jgi:ribosome-binding protein aMBF1 (putative translation factor)
MDETPRNRALRVRPDFFQRRPGIKARRRSRVRGTLFLLEQPLIAIAVGRAVRGQRHSQDLSQEALATEAEVNPKHLSELERGRHDPQASTLLKLARGLGLSCEALGAAIDEELARREERVRRQR